MSKKGKIVVHPYISLDRRKKTRSTDGDLNSAPSKYKVEVPLTTTLRRYVLFFFQLRTAVFKAYCAIRVRCSNFSHQASPHVSPRESTQRQKVELWARNVR